MVINLTPAAAEHVTRMLEQRSRGIGLRVGTKKSGCTGFSYVVDYADAFTEEDQVVESQGGKVVVNAASMPHLDGMEIDFVRNNLLNEGFEFRNPNVKDMCGCGESFSV